MNVIQINFQSFRKTFLTSVVLLLSGSIYIPGFHDRYAISQTGTECFKFSESYEMINLMDDRGD